MESYTIRILYRNQKNPAKLAGLVEENGIAGKRGFAGVKGLWRILNTSDSGTGAGMRGTPREHEMARGGDMVSLFPVLREE